MRDHELQPAYSRFARALRNRLVSNLTPRESKALALVLFLFVLGAVVRCLRLAATR